MSETKLEIAINNLTKKIDELITNLNDGSKTANKLQKWLIFWTIVMAIAVSSQAVLIGMQIFGK